MLKLKSLCTRPAGPALFLSLLLAAGALLPGAWAAEPAAAAPQALREQQRAQAKAQREAERAQLAKQRSVNESQQMAAEALCYKQFAVEDCLLQARRAGREKEAPLRARELEINDAERRERGAERLQQIEEKQAGKAVAPMQGQQRGKAPGTAPGASGKAPRPPVDEPAVQQQRSQEARQRAARQADYVQRRQAEQQQRQAEVAQREPKARADHEAKLKAAAEHKAKALQAAREKGRTAAPLPPP